MNQKSQGYLPYIPLFIPKAKRPGELAAELLQNAHVSLPPVRVAFCGDSEDWRVDKDPDGLALSGGERGVLLGAQQLVREAYLQKTPALGANRPYYALRMLNHWDNLDGTVERGYAGPSLFFKNGKPEYDPQTLHRYGMMLSAAGINAACLNNVNVHAPADRLITKELLPNLARAADILRVYGVRLLVAVDYAMPEGAEPGTADPLCPQTQAWWAERANLVYRYIPDLAGFLVKADSEHRAGPYAYGRNHAQGANLLARALRPYGGVLIWRCFVYNCQQDWRDRTVDRPKAAYENYAWLDGQFDDNVILQIKNGPYDFQVREPVSPLLFSMPATRKAMELQLAQEYTGHQIDLFFMPPKWRDIFDVLPKDRISAICAVSNLGDCDTWAGHDLALANLYAYGRLAMTGDPAPRQTALEAAWLLLGKAAAPKAADMLLTSSDIYERYTAPLGLGWMVRPDGHYGPSPDGYEFSPWGTYNRADRDAVGIERGPAGTDMTGQYPPVLMERYASLDDCPEELLLFFHRVRYDHVMKDGRTLLQRIYDDHFQGLEEARALARQWDALSPLVDPSVHARVADKFRRQVENARQWCDVVNAYFYRFTGVGDEKGRKIYG